MFCLVVEINADYKIASKSIKYSKDGIEFSFTPCHHNVRIDPDNNNYFRIKEKTIIFNLGKGSLSIPLDQSFEATLRDWNCSAHGECVNGETVKDH